MTMTIGVLAQEVVVVVMDKERNLNDVGRKRACMILWTVAL